MWTFPHRLLRYRQQILLYRKGDAIKLAARLNVTRGATDDSINSFSKLFQPAAIKEHANGNIGVELTGEINKAQLHRALNQFASKKETFNLCKEYGLDGMYFSTLKLKRILNIIYHIHYAQIIFANSQLPVFGGIASIWINCQRNCILNYMISLMVLLTLTIYFRIS